MSRQTLEAAAAEILRLTNEMEAAYAANDQVRGRAFPEPPDLLQAPVRRSRRVLRLMECDDFWITRIRDNRVRGLLQELREAMSESEDADMMHKLRSTLGLGFTNYAARRERDLRA